MSFDDHEEVPAAAKQYDFARKRVGVVYTLAGNRPRRSAPELLLANYPLPKTSGKIA